MELKDIQNRDIVNLINCESEPIHIPGSIQPHGFLLALTGNYIIEFCSENTVEFIGLLPQAILKKSFEEIFGEKVFAELLIYLQTADKANLPFQLKHGGQQFVVVVHSNGNQLLFEGIPAEQNIEMPDLYAQTSRFVSIMEGTERLSLLFEEIAKETRKLTGYDRVMIYRFDEFYNGEVVAESKRENLESFANQKYPHTDIPAQARELYLKNPLRVIADTAYHPAAILTSADAGVTNESLDLSRSVLRSVSPIHVEYLINMGVRATLTVSLVLEKKLWGLIACHHYSPKNLAFPHRFSALMHGHFLTSQIRVREAAEEFEEAKKSEAVLNTLYKMLTDDDNFIASLSQNRLVAKLTESSGVILWLDGELFTEGKTPDEKEIGRIIPFLFKQRGTSVWNSDGLNEEYPGLNTDPKIISGLIFHPLFANGNDCIIWIRPEIVQTIKWAGNPYEKTSRARLTPRKSFELWTEEVTGKSLPWKKAEINTAAAFAYALEKNLSLKYSRISEDKYRVLSGQLQEANKELANINWIGTHDLKEPLRKIQIFASVILENERNDLPEKVLSSVTKMQNAAARMQTLIEDLLSYSKAGTDVKIFAPVDLNAVAEDLVLELGGDDDEQGTRPEFIIGDLPVINGIGFQLKQLFLNLLANAIKFSRGVEQPNITIECSKISGAEVRHDNTLEKPDYYRVRIADNGIGFEQQYAHVIFDVFKRLHSAEFPGTGIGLAICKKIMENHSGFIEADSAPGAGTIISMYFPI